MNFNKLASLIAKKEGKKHQASVADVREILKIYFDLFCDAEFAGELCDLQNAEIEKRYKRKKK